MELISSWSSTRSILKSITSPSILVLYNFIPVEVTMTSPEITLIFIKVFLLGIFTVLKIPPHWMVRVLIPPVWPYIHIFITFYRRPVLFIIPIGIHVAPSRHPAPVESLLLTVIVVASKSHGIGAISHKDPSCSKYNRQYQ